MEPAFEPFLKISIILDIVQSSRVFDFHKAIIIIIISIALMSFVRPLIFRLDAKKASLPSRSRSLRLTSCPDTESNKALLQELNTDWANTYYQWFLIGFLCQSVVGLDCTQPEESQ